MRFITRTERNTTKAVPNKATTRAAPSEPEQERLQDKLRINQSKTKATAKVRTIKAALSPGVASLYSFLIVLIFSFNFFLHCLMKEDFFLVEGTIELSFAGNPLSL